MGAILLGAIAVSVWGDGAAFSCTAFCSCTACCSCTLCISSALGISLLVCGTALVESASGFGIFVFDDGPADGTDIGLAETAAGIKVGTYVEECWREAVMAFGRSDGTRGFFIFCVRRVVAEDPYVDLYLPATPPTLFASNLSPGQRFWHEAIMELRLLPFSFAFTIYFLWSVE